jgi:lysozyme family protein
MGSFDYSFERLMILEGHKFTNDPDDKGGPTKFGISSLAYPDENIAELTLGRAKELYRRDYWKPLRCDEIPDDRICFQLFESAVHLDPRGKPYRSVKIAQYALKLFGVDIKVDGIIGPVTVGALNSYPYKETLMLHMNCLQYVAVLIGAGNEDDVVAIVRSRLPQLKKYLRGWMRRIVE